MNAPIKLSILSQRTSKQEYVEKLGGKIRSGIKLLNKTAKNNPKALEIYQRGVAARKKYSEIEKEIKESTGIDNPMFPMNTPYFNVAPSDFGMPEVASIIIDAFGEMRAGDTEKRLYRFPVVFHSDDLNVVYPNEFRRYGGSPGYHSQYGENGVRYCKYLPEVTPQMLAEQKAKRIKRTPRREEVIRGECQPGICSEFQSGQCKFRGRLKFYLPGIPTTGLVAIETTSEYAAEAMWADLERLVNTFGGIPRSNPNKPGAHLFYITKVQEKRSYFDEKGDKKTGLQWVPKLQADIDMGSLIANSAPALGFSASVPVGWLAKPKGLDNPLLLDVNSERGSDSVTTVDTMVQNDNQRQKTGNTGLPVAASSQTQSTDPFDTLSSLVDQIGLDEVIIGQYLDIRLGADWANETAKISEGVTTLQQLLLKGNTSAKYIIQIGIKRSEINIDPDMFNKYLQHKYGKGYSSKENTLSDILNELEQLTCTSPETAQTYIKAELANYTAPV